MNTDTTTEQRRQVVAEAAASYTPPVPPSHTMLMPHAESIATLRRKGASYRAIAGILRTVDISISHDALARFCHEIIEQKPARSKTRRRPFVRALTALTDMPPSPLQQTAIAPVAPASTKPPKEADAPTPTRGRGPRIADPSAI